MQKEALKNNYHSKSIEELYEELQTSEQGLSEADAKTNLKKFGQNKLAEKEQTSQLLIFLRQLKSPLIYLLIFAMIISFAFHHKVDAYVILAVILVNAGIGFFQERKAETAIHALKKMVVSYAKVYRGNQLVKLNSTQLVPGDIILLEEGDKVPADCRLIKIKNFQTQESSLTGESVPSEKSLDILEKLTSVADRKNMAFMSTIVATGQAKALVVSTAKKTQIGIVAHHVQAIKAPTMHFNKKVEQLTYQMAALAIVGAIITFLVGFFIREMEFFDIFLFTIASLVSGIPEGLPAVLAIVLAVGARRMAKQKAIIRHLPAVETLGVTTVITTDKTGTLTQNSMTVEKLQTIDKEFTITGNGWQPIGKIFHRREPINPKNFSELKKILSISSLCNKSTLLRKEGKYEIIGDPTEAALKVLAEKAGLGKQDVKEKLLDDLPFNSDLKFRASLIDNRGNKQLYSVGAFEKIIDKSSHYLQETKRLPISKEQKAQLLSKAEKLASQGYRVLALAYKDLPKNTRSVSKDLANNLIFVSLVAMKDPPRKEIKDAIKKAKAAGIRVIMKTGDHKQTAQAIAKEIGLENPYGEVLTEEDATTMINSEFEKAVKSCNIFARVTPKTKSRIVKILQDQGEVVAMTGDGVNDAPALKRADIGISMGIIGTDVARESSEMVLADDNFASIVNAIAEGRTVFRNVKRTSFFLVTTNVAEDITIVGSILMGFPLPMLPIQLLYLNLVTDGITDVSLAMEPSHEDVLNQKPRNKDEKILNKQLLPFLIITAGLMVLGTLPVFRFFLSQSLAKAQTAAFVSMSMFQLFNVFNMRSLKKSLFKIKQKNKWVTYAFAISFLLMVGVIYVPWFAGVFGFVTLSLKEFFVICLVASTVFIGGELYKAVRSNH
jgi:P-type Ca2+ transporter type 2C